MPWLVLEEKWAELPFLAKPVSDGIDQLKTFSVVDASVGFR